MGFSLREYLRRLAGPKKERSVFSSEKEAYEFVQKIYQETGGVTPELRRAYEFYRKSLNDDGKPEVRAPGSKSETNLS